MKLPKGYVIMELVDERTGLVIARQEGPNTFAYEGADILAQLVAGNTEYVPNVMYLEFANTTAPAVSAGREGRSYYTQLETLSSGSLCDYLRCPIVMKPGITTSDSGLYQGNQATFVVTSSGTQGVSGLEFSNSASSTVYGAALVSAVDLNDRTKDLVFARFYPPAALPKGLSEQVTASWPYKFL